ncbi:MAG: T9SS type A sorting domain-containing protein [Bacteroidales bacterium]|nr:T9SS type A sorting domain-containing protein [Bacteroidales bacterium]
MKKNNLFPRNASYWNKLVQKFYNLNAKISKLIFTKTTSATEINFLLERLNKLFKKLSHLKTKVGFKIAGTALALMLATTSANAQNFTNIGFLQANGTDIDVGYLSNPFFADIDNDGDLDLFLGGYAGNIKVFSNNGQGVFSAGINLQANGSDINVGGYSSPAFADLDEDGDLDLFIGNYSGYIVVFTNNGSGIFSGLGLFQANGANLDVGDYATIVFTDFENDGDLDLFVGNYDGNIKGYLNNGSGIFTGGGNFIADGTEIDVGKFAKPFFVDIDDDSDIDLLVGNYYGNINVFIKNTSFFASSDLMADGSEIDVGLIASPTFVDIDSDGDLDLIVGDYYGTISFFKNLEINVNNSKLQESEITVSPNPTKNLITISYLENLENYNVQIIDISGKIVESYTNLNENSLQIDLSGHNKGIYILKIFNDNVIKTSKIILE